MTPVALITGGGSGIGRATAIELGRVGYALALVGRRETTLRETLRLCGVDEQAIVADLDDPGAGVRAVDAALSHFGRLDAVINNAGWSAAATIAQTTPDLAARVFSLNALTPAAIISRAWPALERQARAEGRGGVIVNVSSMATVDPFPMLYAYAAAKSAVNSLARSAAIEGRPLGIRAFAVAPGAVETDLLRTIVPVAALPPMRTLRPEAVARVIAECVTGTRDAESGRTILLPSP